MSFSESFRLAILTVGLTLAIGVIASAPLVIGLLLFGMVGLGIGFGVFIILLVVVTTVYGMFQ